MKRTQVAALLAGAALGLAGVAVAVILSREEGRAAAGRLVEKSKPVAEQAKILSGRAARTAAARYQTLAPKATEAWSNARDNVNTISSRLPLLSQNGKREEVEPVL